MESVEDGDTNRSEMGSSRLGSIGDFSIGGQENADSGNAGEILTRIELDLDRASEKFHNLHMFTMRVATLEGEFEAFDPGEDEEVSFASKDTVSNTFGSLSPPAWEETKSVISIDRRLQPDEIKQIENTLPRIWEDVSCLVYLSVFAILGVLTRYLLQKLFGPGVAGVTGSEAILYLDLPSNMVGSFLMGWFGVVFKPDISRFFEYLAIGLSTGYLGSLTTFSGWNQKMVEFSAEGKWVFTALGFIIGLFLTSYSIIFGVETANGFRWLIQKYSSGDVQRSQKHGAVNRPNLHITLLVVMFLVLGSLWAASAVILTEEFSHGGSAAKLWLACLVGPPGAWMRWYLAKLNGVGLGKHGRLKWLPIGTLTANVTAACLMASLSTVMKAVNDKTCDTVASGIEFGFLGCLSTVSTFMAEFNAMRQSEHPWRAYAYAAVTICISCGLGTLLYDLPVWLKGYR
ncbi:hypothetical protein MLD38_013152 [Melastoma candidum]|uniref:Uncharacterized protein n=1 Tax=Melastoma candidum TaxID=119954 RepID=A0ACB9RBS0_9MYRT|nr:hypothetical protein MLD38_013152 [Melastoma candidum]